MQVLQQASNISAGNTDKNYEMIEYVISLREGIMDAYDGIIIALKDKSKITFSSRDSFYDIYLYLYTAQLLAPYVGSIFAFLSAVNMDPDRSEALMRSAMGVLG